MSDRYVLLAALDAMTAERDAAVATTREALAGVCDGFVRERSAQVASPELDGDSDDDVQRREWVRCKLSEAARCRDAIRRWTP